MHATSWVRHSTAGRTGARLRRAIGSAALLGAGLAAAPAGPAAAATLTVTEIVESASSGAAAATGGPRARVSNGNGLCSLPEAIEAADTNTAVDGCPAGTPGMDTITLPAGTDVAEDDLLVSEPVTIAGPDAGDRLVLPGTSPAGCARGADPERGQAPCPTTAVDEPDRGASGGGRTDTAPDPAGPGPEAGAGASCDDTDIFAGLPVAPDTDVVSCPRTVEPSLAPPSATSTRDATPVAETAATATDASPRAEAARAAAEATGTLPATGTSPYRQLVLAVAALAFGATCLAARRALHRRDRDRDPAGPEPGRDPEPAAVRVRAGR